MRIIEPYQFEAIKKKRKSSESKKKHYLLFFIALIAAGYIAFSFMGHAKTPNPANKQDQANSQAKTAGIPVKQKLKILSPDEFKKLYSSFAYPNTQSLQEKPSITGNEEADKRIQNIAESRGYKLSSVPVSNIIKTGEPDLTDDDLIQPNALIAWQKLRAAALKDGIHLQMTSAYRSIEFQRALFLRRMKDDGVYAESVAAGYVDDLVVKLLSRAAPPGYSRHHTGYTMDLACDGVGLEAFKITRCYSWLSKNNYENAKKFGWVPSYPEGATQQGPEPEPWEFIWVSTYSLYE